MMRFALALVLCPVAVTAQDFSENSEAKSWNLYGEVPARFEARVTDALCAFTGDCPDDCGAGRRQLVLIRTADDVMVLPNKNSQAAFNGAALDLAPFCNQTVELDGLLIEDEDVGAQNVYLVQRIKSADGEWQKANTWTKKWAAAHPEAKGKGPWFRRDPRVKAEIAKNGYLGLGLEADAAFIKEHFE